jgi:GNAT superfamily N-acetyltransferase
MGRGNLATASCVFRPLEPADAEAAAALWHEAWHDAHAGLCPPEVNRHRTRDAFLGRIRGFDDSFVAEDFAGVVAFAALVGAEVDQFFVARRGRGTGLAARFMDRLETILTERGVAVVELECAVGNERARRFYLSRGFVETGLQRKPVWMPDGSLAVFPMHCLKKRLGP